MDKHGHELRYVTEWKCWYHYDGKRWQKITKRASIFTPIRKMCAMFAMVAEVKFARAIASAKTVAAVETLARADTRVIASIDLWDADPWLLNA